MMMDYILPNQLRVLAIDPSPDGFGFAVLEGPQRLIDWGVKCIPPEAPDKNAACLQLARQLIERCRPHVLAIENAGADDSHRHKRVRALLQQLQQLAREKRVRLATFSPTRVHWAFRPSKDVIAAAIAGRFPELAPRLPSPRACGDSEHPAMPVFDAAALAATFFYFRNRKQLSGERAAFKQALRSGAPSSTRASFRHGIKHNTPFSKQELLLPHQFVGSLTFPTSPV